MPIMKRQRMLEARRAALRNRLIGDGLLPDVVDGWLEHWQGTTAGDAGSTPYWGRGVRVDHRSGRRRPGAWRRPGADSIVSDG